MNNPGGLFFVFELLAFFSYGLIFFHLIRQKKKDRLFEFLSATVFGMLLEIGNIWMAGTYQYSDQFLISIHGVPLAIGFGWAVIIYSAMAISDRYKANWQQKVFLDSLIAFSVDLAIDAVAIRLGFWQWMIPLEEEWFGVPYENLAAWILVVLAFSFLMRYLRTLKKQPIMVWLRIISPFLAYAFLLLGLFLYGILTMFGYQTFSPVQASVSLIPPPEALYSSTAQMTKAILLAALVLFLIKKVWYIFAKNKKSNQQIDWYSFWALTGIHVFFLLALLTQNSSGQFFALLVISLLAIAFHLGLHFYPVLKLRK